MVYEETSGDVQMAFVGDALVTRRLNAHREPAFLAMKDILTRADVTFANAETLFHNFESAPIPDAGPYGTYVSCDPAVIDDLKALGIDMVSTANNHCYDYGEEGILTNLRNLREHGMPAAGTGRNLSEAVAPAYLDTHKGSVGLLAVTLTMPPQDHRAGDPRGLVKGRPGANVLRHTVTYEAPQAALSHLRDLADNLGLAGPQFSESDGVRRAFGQRFRVAEAYSRSVEVNEQDFQLNLRWVADACRFADWVVVSMHNHERGATAEHPPEYAQNFARACIDAGADVVFGHGPHRERGIEIYNGKPIIYALGDFVLHNELIKWQPNNMFERFGLGPDATTTDAYEARSRGRRSTEADRIQYESAIVTADFKGGCLSELRVHPLDLGYSTGKRSQMGRPVLASGEVADRVLDRVIRLSGEFGTQIDRDGNCAVVRL
jgi:poly-gamma-glutamate synthesis protein (capsule biosynthesis protein)